MPLVRSKNLYAIHMVKHSSIAQSVNFCFNLRTCTSKKLGRVMGKLSFSDLTSTFFLQTFVLELMHAAEQEGHCHCEQLIEHIAHTAGDFFEEAYREENELTGPLDRERYTDLIIGLKNKIGGQFSLASSDPGCIRVVNSRCPFGSGVTNFPELCRMTSSVFGGIAARNFGYAKVEIRRSIARQQSGCEVCIYTDRKAAEKVPGIEYTGRENPEKQPAMEGLQARIESKMQQIWRTNASKQKHRRHPPVIIAKSPRMQKVLQAVELVAPTAATVLIQGETGVGKELIARAIHAMSERSERPFLPVNCGAIPESLVESVLFGHEKGAFTGALEERQGYFERAAGGTLFLDEIDTLSPAVQTRLLRILQEGEFERVGGQRTLSVDTRIIAATNQTLEKLVEQETFRRDLYYRINVVRLFIPSLSERAEDLPYLVNLLLKRLNDKYNRNVQSVSREVMQQIRDYSWPGNVRELENILERSFLFCSGNELTELDMEHAGEGNPLPGGWQRLKQRAVEKVERDFLESSLRRFGGDVNKVAENMAITPRAVYNKMKKYRISVASFRA